MARRASVLRLFLVFGIFAVAAGLAHALWLPWLGDLLIHDDGPAKADIAVVLGGDFYGHRIEKAAELVRAAGRRGEEPRQITRLARLVQG